MSALAFIVLGYLLGSIPFGLLLTKMAGLGDIRSIGSGNIGATNVLRTGNKKLAAATLLLDMLKGAAAVLIAYVSHDPLIIGLTGLAAMLGHVFPVWLKFKGGKGVATAIGVLLAFAPYIGVSVIAIWLIVAFVSRVSSLSALSGFAAAPVIAYFIYGAQAGGVIFMIAALVFWRHKDNIKRLIKGEESKISFRKQDAAPPA